MLPLAHIYTATETLNKKTPLLVFGSVIADISTSSGGIISRTEIHDNPKKFYDFVDNSYPELLDLAIGVRLHSGAEKGADYYSDGQEETVGFAYKDGKALWGDVSDLLGYDVNERVKILSHNFIEAGVDLMLNERRPEVLNLFAGAVKNVDKGKTAICMADYLKLDEGVVKRELEHFFSWSGPDAYTTEKGTALGMVALIKERLRVDVDTDKTFNILNKSKLLMKNKYKTYLDVAISGMKEEFRYLA